MVCERGGGGGGQEQSDLGMSITFEPEPPWDDWTQVSAASGGS